MKLIDTLDDDVRTNAGMGRRGPRRMIARFFVTLLASGCAHAAMAGAWSPSGTTSVSITGPITLTPTSLTAYGATFPLRLAASVKAFHADDGGRPAKIFAITQPTNPPLLNGNKLCGPDPATWLVAVDRAPAQLELIASTGTAPPKREESPNVCGIFYYDHH
jgi:hypothetical protein